MTTVYQDCGALVWYGERTENFQKALLPKVSICCMKGKISIPLLIEPPRLLQNLFNRVDPRSSAFISNIRSYNNMFSFTSMGGHVESRGNDGRGPPQFVISGQNYHRIGSLLPQEGHRPKFCQLYIYIYIYI
jgi:hypothetical protein